ncbi:MAG TPA: PD-(D/E)XK nuclease family protein, partial [bacterium]
RDFSDFVAVFPGQRPALYLRKHLFDKMQSSFISPRIFSMDNFMEYIFRNRYPEFKPIGDLDAVWMIYRIINDAGIKLFGRRAENFLKFLQFGYELLEKINELDAEMVAVDTLQKLKSYYEESGYPVLNNLGRIIKEFHASLMNNKIVTRGMMYRMNAEIIDDLNPDVYAEFLFCGLFALTGSEIRVLRSLMDRGIASFYTQIENEEYNAIRRLKAGLNAEIEFLDANGDKQPEIHYYKGFDAHSEIIQTGEILLGENIDPLDTVIVLPEASALVPLLSTVITKTDTEYNVSMGYPLLRTPHLNLIECIFNAQENRTDEGYYVRDYLNLILHPYLKNIGLDGDSQLSRILVHKIKDLLISRRETFIKLEDVEKGLAFNNNNIYTETLKLISEIESSGKTADRNVLEDFLTGNLHRFFFKNFENISTLAELAASLKLVFKQIVDSPGVAFYPLSGDVFTSFLDLFDKVNLLAFGNISMEQYELQGIFRLLLERERLPFKGYPLKGMQILGLLETRNLKFKNVIFLDVNEGVVPSVKKSDPILPEPVRGKLGLSVFRDNEDIYRYHFSRLLNGAERVFLIYKENDISIRSRFVEELIWKNQIEDNTVNEPPVKEVSLRGVVIQDPGPMVHKDQEIIGKLRYLTMERGLSYSGIAKYLNCPLSFYYSYVLGLEKKEDLEKGVSPLTIGSLIHEILADFYNGYKGQTIMLELKRESLRLKDTINVVFAKYFKDSSRGEAFLLKEIISNKLNIFLKKECETYADGLEIILIEEDIKKTTFLYNGCSMFLIGKIDRINRNGDKNVIIDYKTGSSSDIPHVKTLTESFPDGTYTRSDARKFIRSFQLPVYIHLFRSISGVSWDNIDAVIYNILNNSAESLFKNYDHRTIMEKILIPSLGRLIQEMMNPDIPFVRDDSDKNKCAYCTFRTMCRRM